MPRLRFHIHHAPNTPPTRPRISMLIANTAVPPAEQCACNIVYPRTSTAALRRRLWSRRGRHDRRIQLLGNLLQGMLRHGHILHGYVVRSVEQFSIHTGIPSIFKSPSCNVWLSASSASWNDNSSCHHPLSPLFTPEPSAMTKNAAVSVPDRFNCMIAGSARAGSQTYIHLRFGNTQLADVRLVRQCFDQGHFRC